MLTLRKPANSSRSRILVTIRATESTSRSEPPSIEAEKRPASCLEILQIVDGPRRLNGQGHDAGADRDQDPPHENPPSVHANFLADRTCGVVRSRYPRCDSQGDVCARHPRRVGRAEIGVLLAPTLRAGARNLAIEMMIKEAKPQQVPFRVVRVQQEAGRHWDSRLQFDHPLTSDSSKSHEALVARLQFARQ